MTYEVTPRCTNCKLPFDQCNCWDNRLLGADERFVRTIKLSPEEEELIDKALDDYPNMKEDYLNSNED